jgi:hypothetical protein
MYLFKKLYEYNMYILISHCSLIHEIECHYKKYKKKLQCMH